MDKQTRVGIGASAIVALILYFAPNLGWLYAGPAVAVCAAVAIWGLWPLATGGKETVAQYWKKSGKKDAFSVGLVLIGIGIGIAINHHDLFAWSATENTGPIVWNFEDTARGRGYFLDVQKQPGKDGIVAGFGAHGKNITSEPITDFNAYLRSDRNNEQLPVYILAVSAVVANACTPLLPTLPQDTLGIPAFADFNISTSKKPIVINHFEGMPLSQFMNEFVPFTIVMTYGGQKYQRHFTNEEVDRQIAMLEKLAAPSVNPYVIRKSTAPAVTVTFPPLTPLTAPNATPIPPDATGKIPEK